MENILEQCNASRSSSLSYKAVAAVIILVMLLFRLLMYHEKRKHRNLLFASFFQMILPTYDLLLIRAVLTIC